MKKILVLLFSYLAISSCGNQPSKEAPASSSDTTTSQAKPIPPIEFADTRYGDMIMNSWGKFSNNDVEGWLSNFGSNANFYWSRGDSLVGKAAIMKWWKDRRGNVIDSISFYNQIVLPVKVNQPQAAIVRPGIWLFHWAQVHVKYKSKKSLSFFVHTDYHFNASDSIDQCIQYIDYAPINAAAKK
ncbi:MAG: hypothetical protein ACHQET_01100 [Chitinophagales bacterium]